jgi:hypothetical protein
MSIWGCSSPAHYCQPTVAAGFIDCRSQVRRGSPSPSGFVYLEFSWVQLPLLQGFPFPSILGEVVLHMPSGHCVYLLFTWEVTLPSLSCWVFLPLPLLQAFPLQGCWAGVAIPAFSGQLVYLQFCEGLPLPAFSTQITLPSLLCVFFVVVVVYSVWFFLLFSLGEGRSVQGAILIWPRVVLRVPRAS